MSWWNDSSSWATGLGGLAGAGLLGTIFYGSGYGMGAGALGGLYLGNSLWNSYQQYQENQYQHGLQQDIFAREDNAIQRRVADLKNAGLSPVLAAGNAANSGAVVSTRPPQSEMPDIIGLLKMQNDFETSRTQRELMAAQRIQSLASAKNSLSQAGYVWQKTRSEKVDADNTEDTGITGDSYFGKIYKDITGSTNGKNVNSTLKDIKSKIQPNVKPRGFTEPKGGIKTKPTWMNQADWEMYKERKANEKR